MLDGATRVFVRSASLQRAVIELGCDEKDNPTSFAPASLWMNFQFREREFPTNGEWRFLQASRLVQKKRDRDNVARVHAFY